MKSDLRWALALVPYNGETCERIWRRAIFMDEGGGVSSQATLDKTFYELLLKVPELAPKIRRAATEKLGRSLREQNRSIKQAETMVLRAQIDERKKELRKSKQRPRGGVHEKAVEDIAGRYGMTADALKKRIQRGMVDAPKKRIQRGRKKGQL